MLQLAAHWFACFWSGKRSTRIIFLLFDAFAKKAQPRILLLVDILVLLLYFMIIFQSFNLLFLLFTHLVCICWLGLEVLRHLKLPQVSHQLGLLLFLFDFLLHFLILFNVLRIQSQVIQGNRCSFFI